MSRKKVSAKSTISQLIAFTDRPTVSLVKVLAMSRLCQNQSYNIDKFKLKRNGAEHPAKRENRQHAPNRNWSHVSWGSWPDPWSRHAGYFFSVSPNALLHFFLINILPFPRSRVKITKNDEAKFKKKTKVMSDDLTDITKIYYRVHNY